MTFDEIVQDVMDRLNLTSETARTRIEGRVNDRYRRITSSVGLISSRRTTLDVVLDPVTDTELPEVVFSGIEKVIRITTTGADGGVTVLAEKTYDEITNIALVRGNPRSYAIKNIGPSEVRIVLNEYPETSSFTLHVEGMEQALVLEGTLEPAFPEDFHDILIEGAMSDELRKMEKPQLAAIAEANYATRLSDLRLFIAKSAYMDIYQGKDKPSQLWYRQWYSRNSIYN